VWKRNRQNFYARYQLRLIAEQMSLVEIRLVTHAGSDDNARVDEKEPLNLGRLWAKV